MVDGYTNNYQDSLIKSRLFSNLKHREKSGHKIEISVGFTQKFSYYFD